MLPLVEETSSHYLEGCVNQPVQGWSVISALMAIAKEEDFAKKLEASKHLLTLSYIANIIGELPAEQKVGAMFEVEAGNALFREVHKKLIAEGDLKQPWLGVPGPVAYEASITAANIAERAGAITMLT